MLTFDKGKLPEVLKQDRHDQKAHYYPWHYRDAGMLSTFSLNPVMGYAETELCSRAALSLVDSSPMQNGECAG